MNPRKKESKKWTNLPTDFSNQIKTIFEQNFKPHLAGKKIQVEGRIYPTEIMLRVGINTVGEIRYQNFEVSLDHSQEKQDTIPQIHIAVDAIASLMFDYFQNEEDHELPYTWLEFPFEKQKIWLQFSSVNPELENEANKLLGVSEPDALLKETEEQLEELGLSVPDEDSEENSDDNDIDMSKPQIFSGKKKKEDMH